MIKMTYKGATTSYDVEVNAIKENVVEIRSTLNIPVMEVGFTLNNGIESFDYSAYKTLYRQQDGSLQYSNNGEKWEEPTKTVIVSVIWDDNDDKAGKRPESVRCSVLDNEKAVGKITLKPKTDWQHIYKNVPVSHVYSIVPEQIDRYDLEVVGTTATYTIVKPYEPDVDTQISDLNDMVAELDERVYALEGGK